MRAAVFRLCFVVTLLTLSGCGHTPVMSMYKLRNFDPVTTDLVALRAAIRIPKSLRLKPGGVAMTVSIWRDGERKRRTEKFSLVPAHDAADLQQLASYAQSGTQIFAYKLSPQDVPRFQELRKDMKHMQSQKDGHGSFSIDPKACRLTNRLSGPLYVSTFLKTGRTGEYVPLVIDVDLLKEVGRQDLKKVAPLC